MIDSNAFPDRYVRILAEYCCDPVWNLHGFGENISDLPISEQLRKQLVDWNTELEFQPLGNKYYFSSLDELKLWSEKGQQLVNKVKEELPDWTVEYSSYYERMKDR